MSHISRLNADQTDKFTGFPIGITGDHTYIHKGIGFQLSGVTTSIAAAGTYAISFVTPSDRYVHLRPTGLSSTANTLQMRIAESSTMSGGTAVPPRNRNRNSNNASKVTIAVGATLSTEGSILEYAQVGSGTNAGNASGGSNDGSAQEWVLKPNTTYSIRIENVGATTATFGYFNIFWYEEEAGS